MHFDTALNLVWFLSGAVSLAITLGLSRRTSFSNRRLHLVVVTAVVIALFPYISATDDMLRVEHYAAQHTHSNGNKHKAGNDLLRLYEILDSPLICGVYRIVFIVAFSSLLAASMRRLVQRSIPLEAGRSPPLPFPA